VSIAGVDLSLASTDVALVNSTNVATWRIQSKGTKTDTLAVRAQRIIDITSRIQECIPMDVALIGLEAPSLGQARQAGEHLRSGLWWRLTAALYQQGHPIVEVPPALLKKYATGKGNAAKDEVLASVVRRYQASRHHRQRHRRRACTGCDGCQATRDTYRNLVARGAPDRNDQNQLA
jgi:Holliday junction resolvasome RuvABC endonuclease subunit